MPKIATPLSEAEIRALQPRTTRYRITDGKGLILEVMPTGKKVWRFRYSLNGVRQPPVTIGDYQLVSLRVARAKAQKYTEIVASGASPVSIARQDRGAEKRVDLVRDGADLYLSVEIAAKSEEYQRITRRALDKDVLPAIGGKPVAQVTADDVWAICDGIKRRGSPKMALHTRNVIKRLYEFLISRHLATTNPAKAIAARSIATTDARTRALAPDEIGTFLRGIYMSNLRRPLKLALHLLVLTMARKSELIESTWKEFDLDEALWTVPASRMKNGRGHQVGLSTQAVGLLRELREAKLSRTYVFPTVRGEDRPIAKSTLNQAVKALELDIEHFVLDDFRRTASTHLREMGQSTEAIETALARGVKDNDVGLNNTNCTTERRKILQLWADFVDAQVASDQTKVIG